ncbi:MAG: ribonuclease H-like domain-containing protein [Lachnospiraceae bacterium]|nr:ribonuclease H-like domain-containing protein [Lachnospiraceae bacterium]
MIIKTTQISEAEQEHTTSMFPKNKQAVFFDIETTGFSPSSTKVYLIGCIYFDGTAFQMIQWFSQSSQDEAEVLHSFFTFIQPYQTLIHYNGEGFDMPYLTNRCKAYQLPYDFSAFKSLDLYKLLLPYKEILKLPNLKQKTLEAFLGIERKDLYSGGELISVYYEYLAKPSDSLQEQLLLHNHDDLLGMLRLYPAVSYYHLFHGEIQDVSCKLHPYTSAKGESLEEAIFTFTCPLPLPKEISYRKNEYYLSGYGTTSRLAVQVYTNELKYFFPNYKDYYYLPEEDMSVHKSVAFYVDKNFRTQATAANCYNKKSGRFLPQKTEVIIPYFKQNYKDKQTYFELSDDFLQNPDQLRLYVTHILTTLQ